MLCQSSERHVNKVGHLVEDLLNVTKLEAGQLPLNKSIFPLSDLFDSCCSSFTLKGDLKIVFDGDTSQTVFADQHKIDQVMVNFLSNAVKYSAGNKEILISIERQEHSTKISVKDHGQGINQAHIPHIFERFYRSDKSGSNPTGLGLGLYISSEIIKRHGGEIGLVSILGEGSTFWFTVPDIEQAAFESPA
jgi:signal transduction histidine kinase